MMKFHPQSFLFGVASAVVLAATRKRLRPVAVEIAAVGVHLGRIGLALAERQREHVEDLWAEVEERVREKQGITRTAGAGDERAQHTRNGAAAA